MVHLHILPENELAKAFAEHVVLAAAQAIAQRGRFLLVLSGGNTPRTLYALLATPEYAARLNWAATHVFWSDERCVPATHSASNFLMAKTTLLDPVGIPQANIHRMPGELDPDQAAAAYEDLLRSFVPLQAQASEAASKFPTFDLIHLGMGPDGHIASLFPDDALLVETKRYVAATAETKNGERRLSLTFPVLNAASLIVFTVTGENKAQMVRMVLQSGTQQVVPAQNVRPSQGDVSWFLDPPAAKELSPNAAPLHS